MKGLLQRGILAGALVFLAVAQGGCAVSEADVHRWETTERGPDKLYAVVTHDKYSQQLRVEAALSFIRIKPRSGKRIGMLFLIDGYDGEGGVKVPGALPTLKDEPRRKIVDGMVPELVKQITATPPAHNADGTLPADPSIPFKDAAFGMLSHEPTLVSDEKNKADLTAALITWSQTSFEDRLENPSQAYGVETMMRFFGAPAVKPLPGLIREESTKIDRIAALVADIGDADTKQKASEQLVTLAKTLDAPAWRDKQTPLVKAANERAGQKATDDQVKAQVLKFQDQEVTKIFSAMKRVGGRPVIDYCLAYAAQKDASEDRRKAAFAALEGRIEKQNTADVDKLFLIAKDDATPDSVRDLAFNRIGELPKELVVPKLYAMFDTKKWKVRWVAASLVLKGAKTSDLAEFMRHLPATSASKMGMSEPITYAGLINGKGRQPPTEIEGNPKETMQGYMKAHEIGPKLVGIAYYYGGKKSDVDVIKSYESDNSPVPKCEKDDECEWKCTVPKAPGSQEMDEKTITTVGEFVKFCVEPSLQ
jgi:hypothetical protein